MSGFSVMPDLIAGARVASAARHCDYQVQCLLDKEMVTVRAQRRWQFGLSIEHWHPALRGQTRTSSDFVSTGGALPSSVQLTAIQSPEGSSSPLRTLSDR